MNDLIDREELKKAAKRIESLPWGDEEGNRVEFQWSPKELESLIDKAPSAQQWTPVTEGLPIEFLDRRILVSTVSPTGRKSVDVGLWEGGKWTTYFPIGDDRVTAWMPLPKPYDGEIK